MPRKQKKYHYIYKTTNILNDKFYIGMHSTDNLDDGYVGSGKRLWYSINKHGKENHKTEILEYLPDRELLRKREEEIVNKELLEDNLCMNIAIGGWCGFDNINASGQNLYGQNGKNGKKNLLHGDSFKNRLIEKGTWERYCQMQKQKLKKYRENNVNGFLGKSHTNKTKNAIGRKNSIHQRGEGNSQYGTCWIYSTTKSTQKKIKKSEINYYLNIGWSVGRCKKDIKCNECGNNFIPINKEKFCNKKCRYTSMNNKNKTRKRPNIVADNFNVLYENYLKYGSIAKAFDKASIGRTTTVYERFYKELEKRGIDEPT